MYAERTGMIESANNGATWEFKGYADFHAPELDPVDPSVLWDDINLAFYFFDLLSLRTDIAVVYRSLAADSSGLDFSLPVPAFKYAGDFTDPFILKLPGGNYRMYVHGQTDPDAILSATSDDGITFTLDPGERTRAGGVPGALLLPDNRIRLFVSNQQGMISLISENGLDFIQEPGVRIPLPPDAQVVGDPSPILCSDGKYRMAYKVRPVGQGENPYLDEVYLAESSDGLIWTPGSSSLVTGCVPSMVELPDGRWRIYFIDFQENEPAGIFKLVKTVKVTPDSQFLTGSFARINYVPAIDRFVVTFGTKGSIEKNNCQGGGYAYKEYTTEMQETGNSAEFTWDPDACEANDSGSCMVDNTYYFVHVPSEAGMPYGWSITAYDAVTWNKLAERIVPLTNPNEGNLDPCIAFINGQFDVSDQYNPNGIWQEGTYSHHRFFSDGLDSLGYRILDDFPHISGASMILADNVIHIISADAFSGDLYVLRYDTDWNFIEAKMLMEKAFWAQGVVFDGKMFYVSYLNTSQRTEPGFLPVHLNVHIAAFDRNWELVEDMAVTQFTEADYKQPGRPWLILHDNKLFLSFDCDSVDAATGEEMLRWQAIVKVYEITNDTVLVKNNGVVPSGFSLDQNYPNPFNPATTIRYTLAKNSRVKIVVYDVLGKEIATLVNTKLNAGEHTVQWNTENMASGIYIYKLMTKDFVQARKMMLLK